MGQFYDEIPESLFPWIARQKMFWVATAPLSIDGHVNISPKGIEGTFHVMDSHMVWYEDLSGSGVETIAHLKENGRITIMLTAFEGPPRILRLFGQGIAHEYGTPEYEKLIPPLKRTPGSRAAIVIDIHKVGTSCGYSVPFYDFKSHRTLLLSMAAEKESFDVKTEQEGSTSEPLHKDGLKWHWRENNNKSIDRLIGLSSVVHERSRKFIENKIVYNKDDYGIAKSRTEGTNRVQFFVGFSVGVIASAIAARFV